MANSLLGPITVNPTSASPGQSVFVQVNDVSGRPYTDNSDVNISINGVEGSAGRYYQFAKPGTKMLTVRVTKDDVAEQSTVTIQIAGNPLLYHPTQQDDGVIPIISATLKLGSPYGVTFTLGPPPTALLQPQDVLKPPPGGKPVITPMLSVAPQSAVSKTLASLPADQVTQLPAKTFTNRDGSVSAFSGAFATTNKATLTQFVIPPDIYPVWIWDFGDGTSDTTLTPTTMHDYFPAMKADKVTHSFNVTCTVKWQLVPPPEGGPTPEIGFQPVTVMRTITLVSPYGISKQMGTIVPYHTGDAYAAFQHVGFSASMIVNNIEDQDIMLNQMAVVPISDDSTIDPPNPAFVSMKVPVKIPAAGAVGLGVYVTKAQLGVLGPKVNGFTVYYLGNTVPTRVILPLKAEVTPAITPKLKTVAPPVTGTSIVQPVVIGDYQSPNVCFSRTFRISLTDSGLIQAIVIPPIWDSAAALNAISAVATEPRNKISDAGQQTFDPATNTVAITLSQKMDSATALARVRSSVQAGIGTIAVNAKAISPTGTVIRAVVDPVKAGDVCDPDNISDADAATAKANSLACQLTNQTETVVVPGSFQNALKGDAILSPGKDGADQLIGGLLRALNPPQYHSHSGLMTLNYYEITHCTAAANRLSASANLVGPGGSLGIKPDILQYAWPGSITQTVENAVSGNEKWNDPADPSGNTSYNIGGFNPEEVGLENGVLVHPMVVKPLPQNEALIRPTLRKAADLGRSKGARVDNNGNLVNAGAAYYSFYCYTKPQISAGFTDPAPGGLPGESAWATGLSPAVCASFVWLTMKAAGLNLVGPNDPETSDELSQTALSQGAQVGPPTNPTPDGLFYYSESERQNAGQMLNSLLNNQVQEQEGFFQYIPFLGSAIAQAIADQILNMFAFGNPNTYGSSNWQNPGDANAVSPDNIQWWNPPNFGYVEQLQYLQQHTEQVTTSRWTKVTTYGTVSGTVVTSTMSPVGGANVSLNDMLKATTDGTGAFQINNVPTGSYDLKAWAVVDVNGQQVQLANGPNGPAGPGQVITTTPMNPNLNVQVILGGLPSNFRTLALQAMSWSSDHGDDNPNNAHGWDNQGPEADSVSVGPGIPVNTYSISFDYKNKGYFRCEYDFQVDLLLDLSLQVTITGKVINDGSNDEKTESTMSFNVPQNTTTVWTMTLSYSQWGYHDGPATFTGAATNNQETT